MQAEIEINAPVSKVWSLVSDVSKMPQWSPQCRVMKALGPIRPGTRTLNLNRRGLLFWPTTSVITEVVPERKFAFRIPINTIGVELRIGAHRHRHATGRDPARRERGNGGLDRGHQGGTGRGGPFEKELLDGMNQSLARIKAAAEGR